ncbi:MAG: hypothetical protein A2053_00430 [Deltaproteobacteria bacterium GWA2_50_8]|nr:MAG: hypothetical protein A2053_00430 [Deltaproteobacteria bacterium GWA2_50_8]
MGFSILEMGSPLLKGQKKTKKAASKRKDSVSEELLEIYAKGFESSPNSMMIVAYKDGEPHIQHTNTSFTKYYGYTEKEVVGKNPSLLKSDLLDVNYYRKMWRAVLDPEVGYWHDEIVNKRKNGSLIHVILFINTLFDHNKKPIYFIANHTDISKRKEMEEALRQSEDRFKSISASANDAIIIIDNDGNVTLWNKAAERIFGYSKEEMMGRYLHDILVPQRYHEIFKKGFDAFKISGKGPIINKAIELVALKKDGREFPIELSLSALQIKGQWNAIGIVRDITERKEFEEKLKKSNEELKEISDRKSAFVANVSHEFKNPLIIIRETMTIILDGLLGEINEKQKDFLEKGKKTVDRLMRLVLNLLDIAKIESGKVELHKKKTDMASLSHDILESHKPSLAKKQIFIKTDIDDKTTPVWIDPDRITEVITNLMDNAIKYTPVNGHVFMKLSETPSEIRFEISNSGTEIDEKDFGKIFDKFERITSEREEGTGLGLSIAKDIVELHHGSIWIENERGKGNRFIFVLPKDPNK